MQAYVVTTFIGVFCVDENRRVLAYKPFPKDPEKIAEKLKLSEIELIDEEKQIADQPRKLKLIFSNKKTGVKFSEPGNLGEKFIKSSLRQLAIERGFVKDQAEFNQLLTKVNIQLTKTKIKTSLTRDSIINHVNGALEELDKTTNIFAERLRELYSLHFPEMGRIIRDNEKFVKMVEEFGARDKMQIAELQQTKSNSMGMDFTAEDLTMAQAFAARTHDLYRLREQMLDYLEKLLKETAPNLLDLAGPIIAARLIAKGGGLEKLAKMPSSTVQLLGAEKALFRFMHGEGKSPRFGIIFFHPLVQNAPESLKGKVARALASKLSIASKLDFYSKEYHGDAMKQELQKKVKKIMKSEK